jgi:hypothetical protein
VAYLATGDAHSAAIAAAVPPRASSTPAEYTAPSLCRAKVWMTSRVCDSVHHASDPNQVDIGSTCHRTAAPPPTTRSLPTHTTAALLGSHARPPHTADSETTMLWLGKRAELGLHRAGTNLLSDQGRHRHQVHARALTPLPSPAPRNSLASSTRDARSGALSVGTLTHRTVAVLGSAINRPVGELSTRTGRMGVVAGHYRAGA